MRPDRPIAGDRALPEAGGLRRAASEVARAVIDGFAFCAHGMHPELFCRADEPARPDPDALADDAPRSWRSDLDVELHRVVSLHRFRG
jgi:hypothetical protein